MFGITLGAVLSGAWEPAARTLHGVELWAGRKAAALSARRLGLHMETVEINDDPLEQDLTTAKGFRT